MTRSIIPDLATHEVWFLTGSQTLYGDEVLAQVATQSRYVADLLDRVDRRAVQGRVEAGADIARGDPRRDARRERVARTSSD